MSFNLQSLLGAAAHQSSSDHDGLPEPPPLLLPEELWWAAADLRDAEDRVREAILYHSDGEIAVALRREGVAKTRFLAIRGLIELPPQSSAGEACELFFAI